MKSLPLIALFSIVLISCGEQNQEKEQEEKKQTSEAAAFDYSKSDSAAVALADSVIEAHGGMEPWNEKRYVSWNFLGARDLVWDKHTGLVRIDFNKEETVYLINIHEDTGRVMIQNNVISDQDSLNKLITRGEQILVNDSYWLVFPFKLKDPGVQLRYEGTDTTLAGNKAEVISLQFDSVGYTPQNKYLAYINPDNYLIMQWDFYRNATDSAAAFRQLWDDYKDFDGIKLAAGRGERRLENIQLSNELDTAVFQEF